MQIGEYDYLNEEGCCLDCIMGYQGCLCFDCKCTKCYWYSSPEKFDGEKGHCDYTDILIKEKKIRWRREVFFQEIKNNFLFEKKKEKQEEDKKTLQKEGRIINSYSCQKCGTEIICGEYLIIKNKEFPLCDVCSGKINLTQEEYNKIEEEVDTKMETEEVQEWIENL
jgi:hypothetical protein